MVKTLRATLIISIFSLISGFALLHKGLPPTHDGEYHVVRFYEFDKVLRDGSWYPRWAPDLNSGYGVPLFNYVYPLPNYISSFFHFFGISFIDAFKLQMFLASVIGAIFFYFWAKEFWGDLGGVVSSVVYTYSPYHFLDIYIRGSVGEVWALALFPGFLFAITSLIRKKSISSVVLASIFLAMIIFSHNILSLMFFPFALAYSIFLILQLNGKEKKKVIVHSVWVVIFGVGMASIFWLPALFEQQYVTGLRIFTIEDHFPEIYQLIFPSWGSGFSADSLSNQMSFQIGIPNLLAIFVGIGVLLSTRKKHDRRIILFFLGGFIITVFLMLKISLFVWNSVLLMHYFQFPWRFLSISILITSFLAGSTRYVRFGSFFCLALLVITFVLSINYAKPAYYLDRMDSYYKTRSNFIDSTNSPGSYFNTKWFNNLLPKQKNKLTIISGLGTIQKQQIRTIRYTAEIHANKKLTLLVNTAYFPGWEVIINGQKQNFEVTKDGLFTFSVPKGDWNITIAFTNTPIRSLAVGLSVLSLLVLLIFSIKRNIHFKI